MAKQSIPTYCTDASAVTARNAEYTGTPCTDVAGDGSRNSYLGCNNAASNAPGIGIETARIHQTAAELAAGERFDNWTQQDQDGADRHPQVSGVIGHSGFVDRSSWDELSGGADGKATDTVRHIIQPASVPGTVDVNDTANLVVTDTAAAPGAVMDTGTGAVNQTDQTVGIGDLVWGNVPVA